MRPSQPARRLMASDERVCVLDRGRGLGRLACPPDHDGRHTGVREVNFNGGVPVTAVCCHQPSTPMRVTICSIEGRNSPVSDGLPMCTL